MERKGAKEKKIRKDTTKNVKRSYVIDQIEIHRRFIKRANDYCDTTLEKLAMHPSSPEPFFNIKEISEEDFQIHRERILEGWREVKFEDDELEAHVEDFTDEPNEFDSLDTTPLVGAQSASEKVKRYSIFGKRGHKVKEVAEPVVETDKNKSKVQRLIKYVGKELSILKEATKKVLVRRDSIENPIPSGPRMNTPVEENEVTKEIENMIQDIHIIQLGNRMFEREVAMFELEFQEMCASYSPHSHGTLNAEFSKTLREQMKTLVSLRASADLVINIQDSKFRQSSIFLECEEQYKRQKIAQEKTGERVKGAADEPLKRGTPPKGKRKSMILEDDFPKLKSHSPAKQQRGAGSSKDEPEANLIEFSPEKQFKEEVEKQSKDEAEDDSKEVTRRLRKTSVTDDDENEEMV